MTQEMQSIGGIAATIVNRWAWWQNALKGEFGPIHENDPQQGYYRVRRKGEPWEPVAIFYPEGSDELVAYRNGREVRPDDIWSWCCRFPVTFDAYTAAVDGKGWPDDDKVVAEQVKAEPTIGDNSATIDEAEVLKDQIEAALAGMQAYAKIADDGAAAKALSLRNRLNELSGQADKIRVKQKEPHLEAGKAVDAKWQPLVKSAKAGADKVRDAIGSWETEKLRRQREAERKAEEDRRAAEEAARQAAPSGEVMEAEAPAPAAVEVAPAPIRATYGKSASVSVKNVVKEVTDYKALAIYMCEHPTLQETLRQLAQRALDAGRTNIPGIITEEKAAVR